MTHAKPDKKTKSSEGCIVSSRYAALHPSTKAF